MTPRTILLAWAESGGFAATHGAGASNEAIVDDLLAFLAREGVAIVPREPTPLVERVARAIFDSHGDGKKWEKASERVCELYRSHARAAIAAMREPTEAMYEPVRRRARFYRLQGLALDGSPVNVDVEDRDLDIPAYDDGGNMFEARTFDFCVNKRLIRCQIDRALIDCVAPAKQEAFILGEQRAYIEALGVDPDSLMLPNGYAPFKKLASL